MNDILIDYFENGFRKCISTIVKNGLTDHWESMQNNVSFWDYVVCFEKNFIFYDPENKSHLTPDMLLDRFDPEWVYLIDLIENDDCHIFGKYRPFFLDIVH